jgi:hypothetical protein
MAAKGRGLDCQEFHSWGTSGRGVDHYFSILPRSGLQRLRANHPLNPLLIIHNYVFAKYILRIPHPKAPLGATANLPGTQVPGGQGHKLLMSSVGTTLSHHSANTGSPDIVIVPSLRDFICALASKPGTCVPGNLAFAPTGLDVGRPHRGLPSSPPSRHPERSEGPLGVRKLL